MKLAIMQPYAFPYLGYFQLVRSVDRFVLLDDVTFIKQGWVNRNRILGPHGPLRLTLPIEDASSNRRLCDHYLVDSDRWRDRWLRTIEQAYRRAPEFATVWPVVETCLRHPDRHLTRWLRHALDQLTAALHLTTPMVSAAEAHPAGGRRGVDRLLEICRREQATEYFNPEGGRTLYTAEAFAAVGVRLHFVEHQPVPYAQRGNRFVERLSIIDVLMWNSPVDRARLLAACRIVPATPS